MKAIIQSNNKEFLEQALRFYRNIDKYSALLEIDHKDLEPFKNDIKILLFVSDKRYRSFTESFIHYNIAILRTRLEGLFMACTASKNYSKKIGTELGIIIPWYRVGQALGLVSMQIAAQWPAIPAIR